MSQYYTRATAIANYEVKIHFRCAKCGKEVDLIRYLTYSDMGHASGISNNEADAKAKLNLAGHVADDFMKDIDAMKRNRAKLQTEKNVLYDTVAPLRCSGCGVINIPDAGCERKTLVPAWFNTLTRMQSALLFVSPMILWMVGFVGLVIIKISIGQAALFSLIACIALVALAILINRRLSKKAYDDPALMEKLYNSVSNKEVYADMAQYGLGQIHIGSEK